MLIIPALYLAAGRCVSHYKGKSQQATVLSTDPLRSARLFEAEGARTIHLVDLDTSPAAINANRTIAHEIAGSASLAVQYADGISSHATIGELFDAGVSRVVLNQFSENLFAKALHAWGPEKIMVTIQAHKNLVDGREGVHVVDYGNTLSEQGFSQIIFRDIQAEGTFHPNFDEIEKLILSTPARIFSFGGIGSMDDLEILERTGAAGVIISRAFFEGRLSLRECLVRFEH